MGRYRANGSITVFLSLISAVFLSLICTTIESARVQGARAQTANITDMGNYSVFGEYEKKLLEDYEIFSVDGSYGTGDFSIERVNSRLQSYLSVNVDPKKEKLAGLCFDPWNLKLVGSEITEYALLTDQGGEPFYQQAVAYMKKTILTGSVGKLFQYHRDAQTAESRQEEYERRKNSSDQDMKELEQREAEKKKELEERKKQEQENGLVIVEDSPAETVKKENPLKALNRLRKKSILEIACGSAAVSEKKVTGRKLASRRSKEKGSMKLEKRYSGLTCDLLFREYLLDHFPNYRSGEAEGGLDYQVEYMIAGKNSDKANLKSVIQRLLLIREGLNYLYCAGNGEMSAQAGSLAALLIGWTGIPALITVMKHALLLGWSYGESLLDVRTLMDGGKIPLNKTPGTWMVTLDNLGRIHELLEEGGKNRQEGIAYRDYLRILLNLQSVSDQKKRAVDMIELNLQSASGLSNFQADHCVVGIRETTEWEIPPVFSRGASVFLGIFPEALSVTVDSGFSYDG